MEQKQFYFIGDKCIACGRCALVCPESCIGPQDTSFMFERFIAMMGGK